MRLITAIGCCLLLATFVTTNPDVSHSKYIRRPFKKHIVATTTLIPNTKPDLVRKESTYVFKPRIIMRKSLRKTKLTTEMLLSTTPITTMPTTLEETIATQTATTATTSKVPRTMETTENDDSLSVINNSDSVRSIGSDGVRSERDGKSLQDAWDIRHNIPGEPGVDYPIYFEAPDSKFDCENRHDGYYADIEARCQVFHVCANTALAERGFIFLCPNGTVFSQEHFVCDWYTNVNCPESEKYYYKNEELGRFIGSKEEMLLEVQKMFNYTLRNLLNTRPTGSNENGIQSENINGDGNSIADGNLYQHFGNYSTIPVLNPKMSKTANKTRGRDKTTVKDEVYISNLGELSTDPDADFDLDVVKEQAKMKWEEARKNKEGSFSELWGKDVDQLDTILSQNRLKKSSDGQLFLDVIASTSAPRASTITKRDVSHLLTTPEYSPPNRYLPSLRKVNLRPQTGYYYNKPTSPVSLTDTVTTTENYVTSMSRRTRPPTTKQQYTGRPTPAKTTIVTAVTYPTTTAPITMARRRPTFRFDVTDKSDSILEYRGNFQTTENIRGDQKPDDDLYDDIVDFESKKEKPTYQSSTGEILFENGVETATNASLLNGERDNRNFPSISSTQRNNFGDTIVPIKKVTMMKRPIIRLMPPYKINRTMDDRQEIGRVNENSLKPTMSNIIQNNGNLMVVFASSGNISNSSEDVISQNKFNIEPLTFKSNVEATIPEPEQNVEDTSQLYDPNEHTGGSLIFIPPFGDEQSTISSIINQIGQSGDREGSTVKISTQIIDLEDQDLEEILIDPQQLNIRIRPEIEENGGDQIESTTIRIDTEHKVELPQLENVQTNNRDDRLALIQKMIKMLEQKMKLKHGDLPAITDERPSAVTSRFLQTTTTRRPVTQFSLDNIIKETNATQSQGVGANLIFAMMKILENAQNKSKSTLNARPGDGSVLQPIFSSLTNAQTESPINIPDEDILNNEDILSKTINLLQNSDDEELKSILEVNEIEQIRKDGNLVFVQTTPKIETVKSPQVAGVVQNEHPQITIKEMFRNGNTGPTTIALKPEIKSIFDSSLINRLSESSPVITKSNITPTSELLTARLAQPAPKNVIKYTFGTQITNDDPSQATRFSEDTQMHKPISDQSPITDIETTFDSLQDLRESDPFVAISKTRLAAVAPTIEPAMVTSAPGKNIVVNSQQYDQGYDPTLAISKTRIAEVEPSSEPFPATKISLESQNYNGAGDQFQKSAEVAPLSQQTVITSHPDITTAFNPQQYNYVSDPSNVVREPTTVTSNSAIQTDFDPQQFDQINDPYLDISKTRISEVLPESEPYPIQPQPSPIETSFESHNYKGVADFPDISKISIADDAQTNQPSPGDLQPIIDTLFNTQQYNRPNEPSQAISQTRVAEIESSVREPKPIIQNEFQSDTYNQIIDPSLDITKTRVAEVAPPSQPLSITPQSAIKTSFESHNYNQVGDSFPDTPKMHAAEVEPTSQPSPVGLQPVIDTSFISSQYNKVNDPPQVVSNTRITEIEPAKEPKPLIQIEYNSQPYNQVYDPSLLHQSLQSPVKEPIVKFSFGTQISNELGDLSHTLHISEGDNKNEPYSPTIVTSIFDLQPNNQVGDLTLTNGTFSSNTYVSDPTVAVSKTQFAEATPLNGPPAFITQNVIESTFNLQQANRLGEPSLAISKTRIAEVEPEKGPSTIAPEPFVKTSFNAQDNNQLSDPSLSISKTRIAEVDPAKGPFMVMSEPLTKTSFNSQQYNEVSDPSLSISKTRISEVEPDREPFMGMSEPGMKTSFSAHQYNQDIDPTLSISKTRISEVEPMREPFTIMSRPVTTTSFNSQQPNQVIDPSLSISKTRIAEVDPAKGPFMVMSEPVTKTSFNSQQYNELSDPSLSISNTRFSEVEPNREPFMVMSEPGMKTSFSALQYNQDIDPTLSISKTRISEVEPMREPFTIMSRPVTTTSFNSQQPNQVIDPSLSISKTRIAEVEPTRESFTIMSQPVATTSFNSQQYNEVSDPSLSISKTRIAAVEPDREPFMVMSEPGTKTSFNAPQYNQKIDPSLSISKTRIAEVAPVSGPYPILKPLESFSFETEINNLAHQPYRPSSETVTKPIQNFQEIRIADDAGQIVTPKNQPVADKVFVQGLFDSNYNNKVSTMEPVTSAIVSRTNGGRSNIQIVPETYHSQVAINDQDSPDLEDTDIRESHSNARVEGKFTGFFNNNPDQNNLGVKSKGYVYENKLSPEVLKLYNINTIGTPAASTLQPTTSNSINPLKVVVNDRPEMTSTGTVIPSTLHTSGTTPISTTVSSTTTTPKPVVISTTTTQRPLTTPKPVVMSTTTTQRPLTTAPTVTTTTPLVLTRPVPTATTKTVNLSEAPHVILGEDSIGQKRKEVAGRQKTILISKINPLNVKSTTTSTTAPIAVKTTEIPSVYVQTNQIKTRPQETVTSSPQKKPQIAVKTTTQKPVSTLQPRPQTYVSNLDSPSVMVHQNLRKLIPGIEITPSISQSLGHVVTQGKSQSTRVSQPQSNTANVLQSVVQYPIPPSKPRPVEQQGSFVFPAQQLTQSQKSVGAQVRRPVPEQHQIVFPSQRPQLQQNTNQFTQSNQYQIQESQRGQLLNQAYEKPISIDRPIPEPAVSSQYPFGSEQQATFGNDQNGLRTRDNVIVNIVPSINWYLNDAQDRNAYFQAIQRGLIPNENIQINPGHLRYGVPFEYQQRNSFVGYQPETQSNYQNAQSNVFGAQEHARQSEFAIPNINRIPLDVPHSGRKFFSRTGHATGHNIDYVENSNRRSDTDSNGERDSVFRGISSYNVPLASVGKLPCDSDSVTGGGHSKYDCRN